MTAMRKAPFGRTVFRHPRPGLVMTYTHERHPVTRPRAKSAPIQKLLQVVDLISLFICLKKGQKVTFVTTAAFAGFCTGFAHKVIHSFCGQTKVVLLRQSLSGFFRESALSSPAKPLRLAARPLVV
ncbi:MAG: hypothetical protein LBR05_00390 [Azoarcus sp.]|jgi:hypothetical protein|nr:hypothetical protein [Azoarcus sp.]